MSKEVIYLSIWTWASGKDNVWLRALGFTKDVVLLCRNRKEASPWLEGWGTIAGGEVLGEHNLCSASETKMRRQLLRGSGYPPVGEQGNTSGWRLNLNSSRTLFFTCRHKYQLG